MAEPSACHENRNLAPVDSSVARRLRYAVPPRYRLKLAHGAHTRVELRLHASRDFAYAIIIGSLGFVTWRGALAWVLLGLLLGEICITIWDFIEEDKVRRLPAGERAMHAIMGIVYRSVSGLSASADDRVVETRDRLRAQLPRLPRVDAARAGGRRLRLRDS